MFENGYDKKILQQLNAPKKLINIYELLRKRLPTYNYADKRSVH